MKIKNLLREWMILNEKLIIFNRGARSGQVVIGAGGAGSGKGFALTNFMDTSSYKVIDVDDVKRLMVKVAKLKGDKEISGLNLRNPEDVSKLHVIAKQRGIISKRMDALLGSIDKNNLPNLFFDKTLKSIDDADEVIADTSKLGYKPENTHLVWILTDFYQAYKRNISRERVVKRDIHKSTHLGAALTMRNLLGGDLPKGFDGEIYVVLNNNEATKFYVDDQDDRSDADKLKKPKLVKSSTGKDLIVVKDFSYLKVKEAGKPLKSDEEIVAQIDQWININAPKGARK